MEKIQILELFGGIGSPRISLEDLGLDIKAIDYVEIDKKAVDSYNKIFECKLEYNTQNIIGWTLKPDILIHGSPCQDFSIAGMQKGADKNSGTRSSLMWETLRIIESLGEWKPKIVIWENVKNVLSKHMKHNFDKYIDEMNKLGYTTNYEILNAMDFGLPQNRDRVFTISYLDGTRFNFDDLIKTPMKHISDFLENNTDEKYIVTQPSMLKKIGNKVKIIDNHCWTITTKQMRSPNAGVVALEDGRYRYLTERECWRLQGYSDEVFNRVENAHKGRKGCLNGALYKQAGNSIPIPIFTSIFRKMILNETQKELKYEI